MTVNRPRGAGVQELVHAEDPLELEVGPVVQGIADDPGDHPRPGGELFLVRGVSRDEPFVHAAGPHGPPLVVVAAEPDFREI